MEEFLGTRSDFKPSDALNQEKSLETWTFYCIGLK